MSGCRICRSHHVRPVTDFGMLAVTSQFFPLNGPQPTRIPMAWQECRDCGVVQLVDVPAVDQLRPRFPWLTYAEPEAHLDEVVRTLRQSTQLGPDCHVLGLARDDLPLLKRLSSCRCQQIDPAEDLQLQDHNPGMESVQAAWTVERARNAAARLGAADLFVARYALEHAQQGDEFLAACHEILAPDGYLLIEVPDSEAAFRDVDVTVVWEDHVYYFTEETLARSLTSAGFQTVMQQRIPDPMEDRLVWIGRKIKPDESQRRESPVVPPNTHLDQFAREWPLRREKLKAWATEIRRQGGRLAVFGAGHRACTLIDMMGLAEFLDAIIDDSPDKQQYCFPAGGLPIKSSQELAVSDITCCLLVVNPRSEDRIIGRQQDFLAKGGTFVSIYPQSPRALRLI